MAQQQHVILLGFERSFDFVFQVCEASNREPRCPLTAEVLEGR